MWLNTKDLIVVWYQLSQFSDFGPYIFLIAPLVFQKSRNVQFWSPLPKSQIFRIQKWEKNIMIRETKSAIKEYEDQNYWNN